jgi:hypothetical protein
MFDQLRQAIRIKLYAYSTEKIIIWKRAIFYSIKRNKVTPTIQEKWEKED